MIFFKFIFIIFFTSLTLSITAEVYKPKIIIGKSVKHRNIELYRFGIGTEPIIVIAGIHGNESNTVRTAYEIIKLCKENKIKFSDDKALWIIPNANPDGHVRDRRVNDHNVDLNRNFDTPGWKPYYYFFNVRLSCGKKPFSEPETIVLKTFFEGIDYNTYSPIVLSLHSRGNVVLPGDDSRSNIRLVKFIEEISTYRFRDIGYKTTGDLTEWLSITFKIAAATIEFTSKQKKDTEKIIHIIKKLQDIDFRTHFYTINTLKRLINTFYNT